MNTTIKNTVAIAAAGALLLMGFAAMGYVNTYSQSIEPTSFRSFSASGEGKVVAIPDVAEFTFEVITQGGKDIAALQTDNIGKVNKAIDFVKKQSVDGKDIKTQGYNLEPRYQYYNCSPVIMIDGATKACPPAEIVGYTVRQSVVVKVRDFTKTGTILGGVVDNGANSVSQLNFTVDDPDKVQSQARQEAIKKAQEKAKAVAKAAGFSLGRLLSIDEGGGYVPMAYYAKSMEVADGRGGAPAPTIEPGSQDVTVAVTLRYEIQ